MVNFTTWIFSKLPLYFHQKDSYKDGNNQGLLERYLKSFGDVLDKDFVPFIDFLGIMDALTTTDNMITHLAETLGNPPDTMRDTDKYRLLLKYVVAISKLKGTVASYELLFSIFGVSITITEHAVIKYFYDSGLNYDDTALYDNGCSMCSEYTLDILDPDNNFPLFGQLDTDQELLELFTRLILFVEPINARLRAVTYNSDPIILPGSYSYGYSFAYEVVTYLT